MRFPRGDSVVIRDRFMLYMTAIVTDLNENVSTLSYSIKNGKE
jgi:hypothetical protein